MDGGRGGGGGVGTGAEDDGGGATVTVTGPEGGGDGGVGTTAVMVADIADSYGPFAARRILRNRSDRLEPIGSKIPHHRHEFIQIKGLADVGTGPKIIAVANVLRCL